MTIQFVTHKFLKTMLKGCMPLVIVCGYAQEKTDTLQRKILREMVVTATKFPVSVRETPRQVQVISSDEILRSGAQDIAQVLQRQSGIMVTGAYSNPGAVKSLFVRGGTNEYTSILIDGIPVRDPSGIGGALDLRLLPLGQIERIEIMKGSQSSLYGSGAISGVVNIITKKNGSSRKKVDLNGNAAVGSFGTGKANVNVGVNTKLVEANIGIQRFFTEGVSAAKSNKSGVAFERDKFERSGVNANLSIKPTGNLTINPYVRFVTNDGAYDGGAFVDADSAFYHGYMAGTGAIVNYSAKKIKTRLSYGYTHIDRKFSTPSRTSYFKGRLHDVDGYVSYDALKDLLTISGGVNYQQQQMLDTTIKTPDPSIYILGNYWNVKIKPLGNVLAELSYRLNVHEKYGINHTYSGAVAWWVTDNLKFFTSYNVGYKAPTLSQLYGRYGANENLKPQQSVSWEVGGETWVVRDKLQATATYYNRQIEDVIAYSSKGYVNRDLQSNQGVEVDFHWSPMERLNVELIYNFMTGNITQHNASSSQSDTTYNNMFKRPAHSFKAIVVYKPVKRAFVRLTGQYVGDRSDVFFDTAVFATKQVNTDAYFLLNAYLEYGFLSQKAFLFADLRNITNIDFSETYGYTTPGFGIQGGLRLRL